MSKQKVYEMDDQKLDLIKHLLYGLEETAVEHGRYMEQLDDKNMSEYRRSTLKYLETSSRILKGGLRAEIVYILNGLVSDD